MLVTWLCMPSSLIYFTSPRRTVHRYIQGVWAVVVPARSVGPDRCPISATHRRKSQTSIERYGRIYILKPLYTFVKQYCPSPTFRVSQLIYKITNLWKFRFSRSSESGENNGKTHSCFRAFRRVMTCVYNKSVILANENLYCFNVFSKVKHFMEQYFKRSLSPLPSVNPVNYLYICELFFLVCTESV